LHAEAFILERMRRGRQERDRGSHPRKRPKKGGSAADNSKRTGDPKGSPGGRKYTEKDLRAAEQFLAGIGVPAASAFKPDNFQLEALEAIEHTDVLVTAPTGSGKTWIAREEIRRLLAKGHRAWYTTPLKALTNSKYVEFSLEFGAGNVGILTGDRKENTGAPLIVGTTEIFRNQLFDALRNGEQVATDLVIIDEAHYLADEDRGHVWEEAIILTPPRIRMLLLSATVGRADEFAAWIGEVRGAKVKVIDRAGSRPVELRAAYLSSELDLYPLYNEKGELNRAVAAFSGPERRTFRRRRR
jgi:superfamily II RNA helicase